MALSSGNWRGCLTRRFRKTLPLQAGCRMQGWRLSFCRGVAACSWVLEVWGNFAFCLFWRSFFQAFTVNQDQQDSMYSLWSLCSCQVSSLYLRVWFPVRIAGVAELV